MANGRTVRVLPHSLLAEFTKIVSETAGADRRARSNRGDPRDYTYDPNPKVPLVPDKCPVCGSKHQFGVVKHHASRDKHWECSRCKNFFSVVRGVFTKR
jgi:hypothetical protein